MRHHFLLILFVTAAMQSQTYFKIFDHQIVWEKIHEMPDSSKTQIAKFIESKAQKMFPDNLVSTSDRIQFKINDDQINLSKFGRKVMSSPMICSRNFAYNVMIEIKDGRCRIIVENIKISDPQNAELLSGTFEEYFTKKNGTDFKTGSGAKDALQLFDQHFADKFSLRDSYKEDSKW